MTLKEIFELLAQMDPKDATWFIGWVIVIGASIIQVAPIKVNPWDWILGGIGKRLNKAINERMDAIEKKQSEFESKFDIYVTEQRKKDLDDKRSQILQFCNECMLHKRHTQEQFRFVIRLCDEYEKYIEDNKLKNGEISDAIDQIREIHRKCLAENSFLVSEDKEQAQKS